MQLSKQHIAWAHPLWLIVLLSVWLLATIGWRPLLLPDEGRYAGVAYEMLWGDVSVPTLNGLPFFHKPPLLYWIDIGAMKLFGVREWSVRVGPALGAILMGSALYLHLRRWHGDRVARVGLLILATTPFFYMGGQYVNHDMGVAGCITAAILAAVRAFEGPWSRGRWWLVMAWAFCGLGVLSKGLIGVVLPGLVVLPWLLAQRRWGDALKLVNPLGLIAFAMVVAPWMIAMQARFPGFFDYFILEQHFRRYTGTTFNNQQPFWFYLWVVPVLTLPWSLCLVPWAGSRQALRQMGSRLDAKMALYVWWVLVIVVFFSMPRSKLVGYVLPMLVPWSALLGLVMVSHVRAWRWGGLIAALGCLALVAALAWKAPQSAKLPAQVLGAQIQPHDRVVFVDDYFYDVPLYARLQSPVVVLGDWNNPEIPERDNWRKELHDALRFAPESQRSVLWLMSDAVTVMCHSGAVWFVSRSDPASRVVGLPPLEKVSEAPGVQLWRGAGYPCPEDTKPQTSP